MKKLRVTAIAAALTLTLGAAGANAAEEWGLPDEEVVRFEAKVVDIACELTGDCPPNCGDGKRQLGLIDGNGKLILPLKNATLFSGAVAELIDFCGKQVIADGLFSTNNGYKIFALQFVKEAPKGKWRRANRFLPKWAAENNLPANSPKVRRWFDHDPRVKQLIKDQGALGLGPEADRAYFEKKKKEQ
jgi:hypothetical protein